MALLDDVAIKKLGFASVGKNVQLSDKVSFYGAERITIGNNVRIDDFCVLAAGIGGIEIGNYVHIAVGSSLIGAGKIALGDFSGLSSRVSVYSSSDDYSGKTLTNPTVPKQYTGVKHADVIIAKHVIVGSGSVILPGVTLSEGVAIGALSLVSQSCEAFSIYAGNPLRRIKERKQDLLMLECDFLKFNTL
jgi:acetyltransferase-like isoleucine patch superfamily enzyme